MFSHITVGTNDLAKAELFYDALFFPLGLKQRKVIPDGGPASCCWVREDHTLPRFYVYSPLNGALANAGNGSMTAFLATSKAGVESAYKAGVKMGGTCEGKPGPRKHYGEGYYGAYLRDPDGNKLHIVFRGDLNNI